MGITVLKKEDGFWLSFESSTGKSALVPITKLMPLPGITTRAVLSTCEECASKSEVAAHSTSDNKTKTEICGKIIESSSICEYCKVRETGQTLDCEICINKSYGNFLGRKLSVIC